MSTVEIWLFVFAAFGGIGGLAAFLAWLGVPPQQLFAWVPVVASKWKLIAGLSLFALSFLCSGLAVYYATQNRPLPQSQQPTPKNIEDRIRAWTDNAQLIIQKREDSDDIFEYTVKLHGGALLMIICTKKQDDYVKFEMSFDILHQDILEKIPKDKSDLILSEIRLGLAKLRWTYVMIAGSNTKGGLGTLQRIIISKMIPITDFNEHSYAQFLDDADFASTVVNETVTQAIAHNRN